MPRWFLQVLTNPCFRAALSVIGLGVLAVVDSFLLGLFSQTHFHNLQNVVLLDLVCSSLTFFFPKHCNVWCLLFCCNEIYGITEVMFRRVNPRCVLCFLQITDYTHNSTEFHQWDKTGEPNYGRGHEDDPGHLHDGCCPYKLNIVLINWHLMNIFLDPNPSVHESHPQIYFTLTAGEVFGQQV